MGCNCGRRAINIQRSVRAATKGDFSTLRAEMADFAESSAEDIAETVRIAAEAVRRYKQERGFQRADGHQD
jgi:hypothetical protein